MFWFLFVKCWTIFCKNFNKRVTFSVPYSESKSWLRRVIYYYKLFRGGKTVKSMWYKSLCVLFADPMLELHHTCSKAGRNLLISYMEMEDGHSYWNQHYLLLWDLRGIRVQHEHLLEISLCEWFLTPCFLHLSQGGDMFLGLLTNAQSVGTRKGNVLAIWDAIV